MKVLYIYPKGDTLIRQHVELLADGLRQSADIYIADSYTVFNGRKPASSMPMPLSHLAS